MQVASKAIFSVGPPQPRPYDVPPPGFGSNHERAMAESKRRARTKVVDIALCNKMDYMFTWTLNPALIDRYDPGAIYPKVRSFLTNAVSRKGFQYVAVPEYHKPRPGEEKPAIHIHGLCRLGQVPIERALSPSGRLIYDDAGRPVYNMVAWKWGFSTCVPLDRQYTRTVFYLTKYITKTEAKIFGKWYLAARGLTKSPELIPLDGIDYQEFRDEQKLKQHEQFESEIYPGLSIISEDYPALGQEAMAE